jgi:hypothetical protein
MGVMKLRRFKNPGPSIQFLCCVLLELLLGENQQPVCREARNGEMDCCRCDDMTLNANRDWGLNIIAFSSSPEIPYSVLPMLTFIQPKSAINPTTRYALAVCTRQSQ